MFDLRRWMSDLPGEALISKISMPGTHNSCALHGVMSDDLGKCQEWTLTKQLESGIRFLDIRGRHYRNKLPIHHGRAYQNIDFSDVIRDCRNFLTNNPRECILLLLKDEHNAEENTRSYEDTVKSYISNDNLFYTDTEIPTLGKVRGKIVLIRRYNGLIGIDYHNTRNFSIQDHHQFDTFEEKLYGKNSINEKWEIARKHFDKARGEGPSGKFYINFCSAYKTDRVSGLPTGVYDFARHVNNMLPIYFRDVRPHGHDWACITLMDYANIAEKGIFSIILQSRLRFLKNWARLARIKNDYWNEYLFACGDEFMDGTRRHSFTFRHHTAVDDGNWWIIDHFNNGYSIYNDYHREFLYADQMNFDDDRRYVFTFRQGVQVPDGLWALDILGVPSQNKYRIRNTVHDGYLYAAEFKPFNDRYRRVFTWNPRYTFDKCNWTFEWV